LGLVPHAKPNNVELFQHGQNSRKSQLGPNINQSWHFRHFIDLRHITQNTTIYTAKHFICSPGKTNTYIAMSTGCTYTLVYLHYVTNKIKQNASIQTNTLNKAKHIIYSFDTTNTYIVM
jgi:hypothetical protein